MKLGYRSVSQPRLGYYHDGGWRTFSSPPHKTPLQHQTSHSSGLRLVVRSLTLRRGLLARRRVLLVGCMRPRPRCTPAHHPRSLSPLFFPVSRTGIANVRAPISPMRSSRARGKNFVDSLRCFLREETGDEWQRFIALDNDRDSIQYRNILGTRYNSGR